jgi:hypothetical protein
VATQGGDDEDGEGGGSDIGALLGNLGPLIGGLSGVSVFENETGVTGFICCVKYSFFLVVGTSFTSLKHSAVRSALFSFLHSTLTKYEWHSACLYSLSSINSFRIFLMFYRKSLQTTKLITK